MVGFFELPTDVIGLIYEFDPTYHLVWSEVVRPVRRLDLCAHGQPIFCYGPYASALCPSWSCQREAQREHDFWERIQEEEEQWAEEQRAWDRRHEHP